MYCVRNVPRSAKSLALGEDNRLTSKVNLPLPLSCVANGAWLRSPRPYQTIKAPC